MRAGCRRSGVGQSDWTDVESVKGMTAECCGRFVTQASNAAEIEESRPGLGEDLGGGDVEGADVWESEANDPPLAGEDCGAGGGDWGELWIPNGPRCSMSDEITVRQADAYWVSPADAYSVAGR